MEHTHIHTARSRTVHIIPISLGCIAQSDSSGISPPMRLPTMSGNFLLAPIPETADYFTVRDIKMAVMGAEGVGKTGEYQGHPSPGDPCLCIYSQNRRDHSDDGIDHHCYPY